MEVCDDKEIFELVYVRNPPAFPCSCTASYILK